MKGNSGEAVKHAVMINPVYFLGPQLGMQKLLRPYAHSFHSQLFGPLIHTSSTRNSSSHISSLEPSPLNMHNCHQQNIQHNAISNTVRSKYIPYCFLAMVKRSEKPNIRDVFGKEMDIVTREEQQIDHGIHPIEVDWECIFMATLQGQTRTNGIDLQNMAQNPLQQTGQTVGTEWNKNEKKILAKT